MAKAHIGPKGPGKCSAEKGKCPYGGDDNHFPTVAEARAEFEVRLKKELGEGLTGKNSEARSNEYVPFKSWREAPKEASRRQIRDAISYAKSKETIVGIQFD